MESVLIIQIKHQLTLHVGGIHAVLAHSLCEEGRVMYTLRTTEDLLAAHEEVIRVRVAVVGRIRHGLVE